jgi:hypothetical protein
MDILDAASGAVVFRLVPGEFLDLDVGALHNLALASGPEALVVIYFEGA